MVIIVVMMKKSVLLLSNAKLSSISISFPMREGAVKFRILPIDRKNCFAFKLLAKDGKMAWCINTTDVAMVLRAVFVAMPGSLAVMTNKVVVRIGGYDGDVRCCGGHCGCRIFAITRGKVRRGRSRGMCDSCSMSSSGRASTMHSSEWMHWLIKRRG